jgi:uncharacterized protein YbcI
MTKFEKEHLGRGPKNVRTYIIEDMILIRLIGVLTPAEQKLATEVDGAQIVKQTRRRLIESSRSIIENIIKDTTGAKVQSLHTDISSRTGERIFVLGLDRNLENEFKE